MASIRFFDAHFHVSNRGGKGKGRGPVSAALDSGRIDGMNLILARPGSAGTQRANGEAFALKKKYGTRVQLAYWTDPREEDYLGAMKRFLDVHPQVTGIKIHPTACAIPISEENFGATLDLALERDLYVITHTQPTPGHSAICFHALLEKRPDLRFIVGHGSTMEEALFMAAAYKHCYVEPSWLGFFSPLFEMAERIGGYHKIMAGTDGPGWFDGFDGDPFEDVIQRARGYLPTMKEVRMFCYDNAAQFFRL